MVRGALPAAAGDNCGVCDRSPTVLVGVSHPVMRRWIADLLAAEDGRWTVTLPRRGEMLAGAIERAQPALVVVDGVDLPSCCRAALDALPPERVVVVGPEPDPAYRARALAQGAAGWLARDDVADELTAALRQALGCPHARGRGERRLEALG